MASFSRKTGVIGALAIAGVLIGGSYLLSSGFSLSSVFSPNLANAASAEEVLKAYAQKDSDGDGLPDWEEALYGTDPNNPHSFSPTLTDGQAVAQGLIKPKVSSATATSTAISPSDLPGTAPAPDSITDQFAQNLFSQYLSQQTSGDGTPPSDSDIDTFAQSAMQELATNYQQPDKYSLSDVKVADSGAVSITDYAVEDAKVFAAHTANTDQSEVDYFADAVERGKTDELKQVAAIGAAYTAIAPDLMKQSVPSEAQNAHLEIANASAKLGVDITDMSMMQTDPLRAYLGLSEYQNDVQELTKGFADLYAVFQNENVTMQSGTPGVSVYVKAQLSASGDSQN